MASTLDAILRASPNVPNFAASNQLAVQGGNQIVSGLDQLRNLAVEQAKVRTDNYTTQVKTNTDEAISRLNQFDTPDQFNAKEYLSGVKSEFGDTLDLGRLNAAISGVPEAQQSRMEAADYFANRQLNQDASAAFDTFQEQSKSKAGYNQLATLDDYDNWVQQKELPPKVAEAGRTKLVNKLTNELKFIPKVPTDLSNGESYKRVASDNINGVVNNLQSKFRYGLLTPETYLTEKERMYSDLSASLAEKGITVDLNSYNAALKTLDETMNTAFNIDRDPQAATLRKASDNTINEHLGNVESAAEVKLDQIANSVTTPDGRSFDRRFEFSGSPLKKDVSSLVQTLTADKGLENLSGTVAKQVRDVSKILEDGGVPKGQITDDMITHVFNSTGVSDSFTGSAGFSMDVLSEQAANTAAQVKINNTLREQFNSAASGTNNSLNSARTEIESLRNNYYKKLSTETGLRYLNGGRGSLSTVDPDVIKGIGREFIVSTPDVVEQLNAATAKDKSLKDYSSQLKVAEEQLKHVNTVLKRSGFAVGRVVNALSVNADSPASLQKKQDALEKQIAELKGKLSPK